MPVYNTETSLLWAAAESVLEQSYECIELLIIDDGSNDDCATDCNSIAASDSRVRVKHVMNGGVSIARNTGIDISKGEYIVFIDSDDTMVPNAIEVMVNKIQESDFVVCGCRHTNVTLRNSEILQGSKTCNTKESINYLCYMNFPYEHIETNAIWGKLYRKEKIGNLRFESDMVMAEDFKFNFEYIMKCVSGKYLDFQGYNYLERPESLSRKYNPRMINTLTHLKQMLHEYEESDVYDALLSRCVNIAFTILMVIPTDRIEEKKQIECFINLNRAKVLRNPLTKKKVKAGIISSYLGYGTTRKLFGLRRRT